MESNDSVSNEVIVERLDGLRTLIELKFEDNFKDHQRIEEQTTKTNGRVTKLESFSNKVIGALIITEAILLPIAFIEIRKIVG